MDGKNQSNQEEIPLHEVVLKLMYDFNKEKPAELTATDIFWKLSDPAVSEVQIGQVLKWLVNEKRVESFSGKYSLDRFEFLDQRNGDPTNPYFQQNSTAKTKEIPLHEVVLEIMFNANPDKPEELTATDIFWKTNDPAISERQIVEVLNWLVSHGRVEHLTGKYSLDRFEFIDQKNNAATKKLPPKKGTVPNPKPAAKEPVVEDKIVSKPVIPEPIAPEPLIEEQVVPVKPLPQKPKAPAKKPTEPKKAIDKKAPVAKKMEKAPEKEPEVEAAPMVEKKLNLTPYLLIIAAVVFIYSAYLLVTMDSSVQSMNSETQISEVFGLIKTLFFSNAIILLIFGIILYKRR